MSWSIKLWLKKRASCFKLNCDCVLSAKNRSKLRFKRRLVSGGIQDQTRKKSDERRVPTALAHGEDSSPTSTVSQLLSWGLGLSCLGVDDACTDSDDNVGAAWFDVATDALLFILK